MKLSVLANLYGAKSLDETLQILTGLGVHTVEIGAGGYPGKAHCNPEELLKDGKKFYEFVATFKKYGVEICALAAHDFETQKTLFLKHIELSEQYNKPLIIHCVRAYPDIISIRKETKARQPWIIHGFRANVQTAEQLLRHEIYISLGDVLFKDEEKSKRLLVTIPSERLFLETDVSERNIEEIYEKAASIIGKDIEVLSRDIFNNFEKIFGKI